MQKISSFKRVTRNIEKMGYYPTATKDVELIATYLSCDSCLILDPCCGEGTALETLSQKLGAGGSRLCIGIEIEETRAANARTKLIDMVLDEDFANVNMPESSFGCVFLNPPYDKTDKLHQQFIEKSTGLLMDGGILVLLIPEYELTGKTADYLASNYENFSVYKSTDPTYKQIILFGKKKTLELTSGQTLTAMASSAQVIEPYRSSYYKKPKFFGRARFAPAPEEPKWYFISSTYNVHDIEDLHITVTSIDPRRLKDMLDKYTDDWDKLVNLIPEDTVVHQPIMPLRKGHLAQVIAGGLTDGVITDPETSDPYLLKGTVQRVTETVEETDNKEIKRTRDVISILLMDKKGELIKVT